MTGLLVSVRDAGEARDAVAAGAAIIDIKEPHRGALGRADAAAWREILRAVAGAVPCSAALGELLDEPPAGKESRGSLREPTFDRGAINDLRGFRYAKLGLAGCATIADWQTRWLARLEHLPAGVAPVAVVYADAAAAGSPAADKIIAAASEAGCAAVLFDTFTKTSGDLFHHLPPADLQPLLDQARAAGLAIVLAGSLEFVSLPTALALAPNFVAVRGAVCRPDRRGRLDAALVCRLVATLGGESPTALSSDRTLAKKQFPRFA